MTSQTTASYAFAPPPVPSVEIAGTSRRFPVHRIYCVGRNYADHVLEMGVDPDQRVKPTAARSSPELEGKVRPRVQ